MKFAPSLLALGLVALPLAAAAQEPPPQPAEPDPEKERIREALRRARADAEVGRRVDQLRRDLAAAQEWIPRAMLLVELADLNDRRAVAPLGEALAGRDPWVAAFALHGLLRLPHADLRPGGGAPLVEALCDALEARAPYHRRAARELLTRIVGEDLGERKARWRSWLKRNEAELEIRIDRVVFDEAGHPPDKLREVYGELSQGGTAVRERIPDVTSQVRELNRRGLDVALCVDQTGSMGAVLDAAKASLEALLTVLGLVVRDHRVGLVTYDDGLRVQLALGDAGRLREVLPSVRAEGGGDMPEGVDKALGFAYQPAFGWRKGSVRCVVLIGDAPPHAPDVQQNLDLVKAARERGEITTHAVQTGGEVQELKDIAQAGGGRSLQLGQPSALVSEVLLLVFGEPMRPAMERFVPVLLEIVGEVQKR